ncbi:MAG TPA: hypothetical protein EYH27_04940 [Anaerolineales bacterium]|nr:hypothetical protein [Anaerolineales bacterium]
MERGTAVLRETVGMDTLVGPLTYAGVEPEGAELLRVLERAAEDPHFVAALTERPEEALAGYRLTAEEQAALLSGDLRRIERVVGPLDARLSTWLVCRLQQEIW